MAIRQFAVLCPCAVLLAMAACSMIGALAQEDPFGGAADPFAPGADPFGPGAVDPFGRGPTIPPDADDPFAQALKPNPAEVARHEAALRAKWHRDYKGELVDRAYVLFSQRYLLPNIDDPQRLDAGLSLLHFHLNEVKVPPAKLLDVFSRLAQSNWSLKAKDESPAEMTERLTNARAVYGEWVRERCFVGLNIPRLRERYEQDGDEPWPLDWRLREEFFVELTETFFTSLRADDPAAVWRQRIVEDKENAELYTVAYLGVLRGRQAEGVDTSLISRYVADADNDVDHVCRLAQTLASVAAARDDVDDFARKRLREKLLEKLPASPPAVAGSIEALASIVQFGDQRLEIEPIMQILLENARPADFTRFCDQGGIDRQIQNRWFLRKTVTLKEKRPAGELLQILNGKVKLPLWIDRSVGDDSREVEIEVTGTWLEVLQGVLDAGDLVMAPLDGDILWIGPEEQREKAIQTLRNSNGGIPVDDEYLAKELRLATSFEFIETPGIVVGDYFMDLHGVMIVTPWEETGGPAVTGELQGLPFHLALTILCQEHGLTWGAAESVVAVGPPEFVDAFDKAATSQRLKRLTSGAHDNEIAAALDESTTLEFIETPVEDVTAYLSDLHSVPVLCVGVEDQAITRNFKGLLLGWALTLMVFDQQLDWCADEYAIYVGSIDAVGAHQRRAKARTNFRETHHMRLGEKLQQRVKLEFIDTPFSEVIGALSKLTGLNIELDESIASVGKTPVTTPAYHQLPADVHLDLLAVALDLTWDVASDGKIVVSKGPSKLKE